MKNSKKVLAVVLSVLMVLSAMVMPTFAVSPAAGVTKSAFSHCKPFNYVTGMWAETGIGTVELDDVTDTAIDYAYCEYLANHFGGYPKGFKDIIVSNTNPDAVTVSCESTANGLKVTFGHGTVNGTATVTISYAVTEVKVTSGIAVDSDTRNAVLGEIVYTVKSACNHTKTTTYVDNQDNATHSIVCDFCGEVLSTEDHVLTTWTETKAPTCTEAGTKISVCEACGATVSAAIDKLPHVDTDKDGICEDCKQDVGHVDKDGDGMCDYCDDMLGHEDHDHDGKCDLCGKDMEDLDMEYFCGHICHSKNWFHRLIYAFVRIFFKTVKICKYCKCGMVHW